MQNEEKNVALPIPDNNIQLQDGLSGLQILNVSNPTVITLLADYNTEAQNDTADVANADSTSSVTNPGLSALPTLSITNTVGAPKPAQPKEVKSVETKSHQNGL